MQYTQYRQTAQKEKVCRTERVQVSTQTRGVQIDTFSHITFSQSPWPPSGQAHSKQCKRQLAQVQRSKVLGFIRDQYYLTEVRQAALTGVINIGYEILITLRQFSLGVHSQLIKGYKSICRTGSLCYNIPSLQLAKRLAWLQTIFSTF